MKKQINIYTAIALALGFGVAKLVDAHYWDALVSIPAIFLITLVIIKIWQR
jgi:hypothetical protein